METNNNEELLKHLSKLHYESHTYFQFILNNILYFQHDLESLKDNDKIMYVLKEIKNAKNVLNRFEKLLEIVNKR